MVKHFAFHIDEVSFFFNVLGFIAPSISPVLSHVDRVCVSGIIRHVNVNNSFLILDYFVHVHTSVRHHDSKCTIMAKIITTD